MSSRVPAGHLNGSVSPSSPVGRRRAAAAPAAVARAPAAPAASSPPPAAATTAAAQRSPTGRAAPRFVHADAARRRAAAAHGRHRRPTAPAAPGGGSEHYRETDELRFLEKATYQRDRKNARSCTWTRSPLAGGRPRPVAGGPSRLCAARCAPRRRSLPRVSSSAAPAAARSVPGRRARRWPP